MEGGRECERTHIDNNRRKNTKLISCCLRLPIVICRRDDDEEEQKQKQRDVLVLLGIRETTRANYCLNCLYT